MIKKISVIIPNLHSPMIDKTIRSILEQKSSVPFEIIVVGMDKFKLVESFTDSVNFVETQRPTPPAKARNLGVDNADGDLIIFIDADCIATPGWLGKHVQQHENASDPIIVGGGVTFPNDHYLTLADNVSSFHEFMIHMPAAEKDFLPSLNLSIPRQIWDKVGGFDPEYPFPAGEDTELTMRIKKANYHLIFSPEAKIVHLPNRNSFGDLFKHAFRFGKYSIKANPAYQDVLYIPLPLRHWLLTALLSPILSAGIIFKMLFIEALPIRYWHTIPIIYVIKIAWCFGFASQLKKEH